MKAKQCIRENRVYPKDENGCTRVSRAYIKSVDVFVFSVDSEDNNHLTVVKNGIRKAVYIEDCGSEYVYKLLKTKIQANHGANGLFDLWKRRWMKDSWMEPSGRSWIMSWTK